MCEPPPPAPSDLNAGAHQMKRLQTDSRDITQVGGVVKKTCGCQGVFGEHDDVEVQLCTALTGHSPAMRVSSRPRSAGMLSGTALKTAAQKASVAPIDDGDTQHCRRARLEKVPVAPPGISCAVTFECKVVKRVGGMWGQRCI
jgi:hypothetical protein